jgi:tetratricopeptide (TPR) repeat protein
MSKAIGDKAAIHFAAAFYRALGYGRDVQTAFELGTTQIDLEGIHEKDTPKLLAFRQKPNEVFFVQGDRDSPSPAEKASTEAVPASPLPKPIKRPWVAVSNLDNKSGRRRDEHKSFGVSRYLRSILETIPTEDLKFGVVPISDLMGLDSETPLRKVRNKTGARFVLKGFVDLRNDPGAIEVELWRTEDETLLWKETFVEPWKDVQAVTKLIAENVVEQVLRQTGEPGDAQVMKRTAEASRIIRGFPEQSVDEFEAINSAFHKQDRFNNLRKDADFREAESELRMAVNRAETPHYEALTQLGFLYILGWETSGDAALLEKSAKCWKQILEDRPHDPFALVELGYVSYVGETKDTVESIALARKAVESDPEHPFALNVLSLLYLYLGYYESNITLESNRVFPRAPTYVYPRANAALAQQLRGRYQEALDFALEAQNIEEKAFVANLMIGAQHYYMGQLEEADRAWAFGASHSPDAVVSIFDVARAWIKVSEGDLSSARRILHENEDAPWLPGPYGPYYTSLAALLGENEQAIDLLWRDKTFAKSYRYLVSEPTLHPLKNDANFHSLLEGRYEEWLKNFDAFEAGLPNLPDRSLLTPQEFIAI